MKKIDYNYFLIVFLEDDYYHILSYIKYLDCIININYLINKGLNYYGFY